MTTHSTRIITPPLPAKKDEPALETVGFALWHENKDAMNGNSQEQRVRLKNSQGLHMRPIRLFVETANRFKCPIFVSFGDKRVNGNSTIEMMFLAAGHGDELLLQATGPDAAEALQALVEVVNRFVEEDETPPPKG